MGDPGSIPGSGRSPGERIGYPLQHSWTGGSVGKEFPCNVGDLGSIPGSGRSPGGEHGNPLQYSCLENSWTEEPGGLQSMRSQRIGHDLTTNTHTHTHLGVTQKRKWQSTSVFLLGESPWTEEPGRLQSMGSQRVGHD